MMLRKLILWAVAISGMAAASLTAADASSLIGVVNFSTCITDSKFGKKEQESMETIRLQFTNLVQDTEKELKEISGKFEDTEYLDSLSPKAEEELKARFQTLNEDLGRYQNQFYQVMNHANYQMVQKMSSQITRASERIAKQKNLDYVINREACFYYRPDLDVTALVISEMDKNFETESAKKLSDNSEDVPAQNAVEETVLQKAG